MPDRSTKDTPVPTAFTYFCEMVAKKHLPEVPLYRGFIAVMVRDDLRREAVAMLRQWELSGSPEIRLIDGKWEGAGGK